MSYSDKLKESERARSLLDPTVGIIFCPICGKKNDFSIIQAKNVKHYFCAYCQRELNRFWQENQMGKAETIECSNCQTLTFAEKQYCVSCGYEQEDFEPTFVGEKRAINPPIIFVIVLIGMFLIQLITMFILIKVIPDFYLNHDPMGLEFAFTIVLFGFDSVVFGLSAMLIHNGILKRKEKQQIESMND